MSAFALPSIIKTWVRNVLSERPRNMDTRSTRAIWHVPSVSVLTGFHCNINNNNYDNDNDMIIITSLSIGTGLAESCHASTHGVVWEDAKAKRTSVFSKRGNKAGVAIYSDVCYYLFRVTVNKKIKTHCKDVLIPSCWYRLSLCVKRCWSSHLKFLSLNQSRDVFQTIPKMLV